MELRFYHTDSFKICHGFLCQVTELKDSDMTGFGGGRKMGGTCIWMGNSFYVVSYRTCVISKRPERDCNP